MAGLVWSEGGKENSGPTHDCADSLGLSLQTIFVMPKLRLDGDLTVELSLNDMDIAAIHFYPEQRLREFRLKKGNCGIDVLSIHMLPFMGIALWTHLAHHVVKIAHPWFYWMSWGALAYMPKLHLLPDGFLK